MGENGSDLVGSSSVTLSSVTTLGASLEQKELTVVRPHGWTESQKDGEPRGPRAIKGKYFFLNQDLKKALFRKLVDDLSRKYVRKRQLSTFIARSRRSSLAES